MVSILISSLFPSHRRPNRYSETSARDVFSIQSAFETFVHRALAGILDIDPMCVKGLLDPAGASTTAYTYACAARLSRAGRGENENESNRTQMNKSYECSVSFFDKCSVSFFDKCSVSPFTNARFLFFHKCSVARAEL